MTGMLQLLFMPTRNGAEGSQDEGLWNFHNLGVWHSNRRLVGCKTYRRKTI